LTTGGLYPLAAKAGGSIAGYFTAFGALFWLLVAAPAVVLSAGIFVNSFLSLPAFGVQSSTWIVMIFAIITLLGTALIAYLGIQLSVRVLLLIELVTMAVIVLLLIITLFKHPGGVIDHAQFAFSGTKVSTIVSGVVLVTFAFGGFESATILGQEAHRGKRNIPIAVISSIIVAGLFITFTQYVTVLGFSGTSYNLVTSPNSLAQLASIDGITWYGYIVTFGIAAAAIANNIALYNAGARLLFTLPREGAGPAWLSRVNSQHKTPTSGVLVFAFVNLVVILVVGFARMNPVTAYGNLGTLSGYGAIVMYVVTCLATVVFLALRTKRRPLGILICLIGAGIMSYGMYTLLVPFPKYPASVFALIFIGSAAAAIVGYLTLRLRGFSGLRGSSVDKDTASGGSLEAEQEQTEGVSEAS
jgi:amino acid transporter